MEGIMYSHNAIYLAKNAVKNNLYIKSLELGPCQMLPEDSLPEPPSDINFNGQQHHPAVNNQGRDDIVVEKLD